MTLSADGNVAHILQSFGGDPQRAGDLAAFLGFEPISNPEDRLAGALSRRAEAVPARPWRRRIWRKRALPCRRAAKQLPAEAGLWIGVLSRLELSGRQTGIGPVGASLAPLWSMSRTDGRWPCWSLPPPTRSAKPSSVFPRTQVGSSNGAVTSVRAHLDLDKPTRGSIGNLLQWVAHHSRR